jgi:hypothetical protein
MKMLSEPQIANISRYNLVLRFQRYAAGLPTVKKWGRGVFRISTSMSHAFVSNTVHPLMMRK